jgi:hypothetical protein
MRNGYERFMPHLMNRQLITILLIIFWTSDLFGKVQNDVNKVLASKDFVAFKKYADNLSKREKRVNSHWEYLRDLTTDFQEGVFVFEKSVPHIVNPSISSVYTFRVRLITTVQSIAYYEFSEEKTEKVGNTWEPYFEIIDSFKDDKLFDSLKNSFRGIFQTDLNENELFLTNFVYGEICGYVPMKPKGRQQIDLFVKNKDIDSLLHWLHSANTEKQIYAVDGLCQLKQMGVILNDKDLKIMTFVINKKGTIYFCSGCIRSRQEIKNVTKKFKL